MWEDRRRGRHHQGVTLFYNEGGVAIFHGDCRDILPRLRAEGLPLVDMVLADPPYGDTEFDWDVRDSAWLDLVAPLMRSTASLWCFGSLRAFMTQAEQIQRSWKIAQEVVWEKHNGSGFSVDRFRRVHEIVLQLYPKRARWDGVYKEPQVQYDAKAIRVQTRRKRRPSTHFGRIISEPYVSHDGGPRQMRSVLSVPSCHGTAVHPTQKPEGILAPLIAYSCSKLGVVLDPMMGAGSTLVTAVALGRRAIGIEISREDCEKAVARLRGADFSAVKRNLDPRQTTLF